MAQVTQVRYPLRSAVRTAFQVLVGLAFAAPLIIGELGVDQSLPIIATVLGVAAAITRIMAIPAVNDAIEKYLPWLAPAKPAANSSSPERTQL